MASTPLRQLLHSLDGVSYAELTSQVVAFQAPRSALPFASFHIRGRRFPPVSPPTFPQQWFAIVDVYGGETFSFAPSRKPVHRFEFESLIVDATGTPLPAPNGRWRGCPFMACLALPA